MEIARAKSELMQIYGMLSPDKQRAIDTLVKIEPCEDAISRQAVINLVVANHMELNGVGVVMYSPLYKDIKQLPPINPQEPKTGRWIEENINEYSQKVVCSECGCPPPFEHVSNGDVYSANGHGVFNKTKYCPNCGAKMESEG